jgi:hypothetical protein
MATISDCGNFKLEEVDGKHSLTFAKPLADGEYRPTFGGVPWDRRKSITVTSSQPPTPEQPAPAADHGP